jgi:hypothetical protein
MVRTIASIAVSTLGVWICALNASVFWTRHVLHRESPSWTPLLGAGLLAAGMLVAPSRELHRWWWIPFLVDWGSVPGLVYSAVWHVRRKSE